MQNCAAVNWTRAQMTIPPVTQAAAGVTRGGGGGWRALGRRGSVLLCPCTRCQPYGASHREKDPAAEATLDGGKLQAASARGGSPQAVVTANRRHGGPSPNHWRCCLCVGVLPIYVCTFWNHFTADPCRHPTVTAVPAAAVGKSTGHDSLAVFPLAPTPPSPPILILPRRCRFVTLPRALVDPLSPSTLLPALFSGTPWTAS